MNTKRLNKEANLNPHYNFYIEKQNFLIKIADSKEELQEVFKLRKKVYSAHADSFHDDLDKDVYDTEADHILIINQDENKIVGTYRLLLSDKVSTHYSEREFDLSHFLSQTGRKLELGRASVDPEMRTGVVIALLWRGIAEYIKASQVDYVFGCSTMWNISVEDTYLIYRFFQSSGLISKIPVEPLPASTPKAWPQEATKFNPQFIKNIKLNEEESKKVKAMIPSLVKAYINAGAKFSSLPAFDPKLNAFEFFGYLKVTEINPLLHKKYLKPN